MRLLENTNIIFSEQTSTYRNSMIREILKASVSEKNLISFAGGLPDSSLLPLHSLQMAMEKTIRTQFSSSLQYGDSMGYLGLREWIADSYFGYFHENTTSSEILVTHGSQQALSLIGNVFLNRNSYVIVESPTYLGALQAFRICSSNIIPVSCDEHGMVVSDLIQILEKIKYEYGTDQKQILAYINPVHQNPSTTTWSEQRMNQIANVLDQYKVISVEDEAYRLLSFEEIDRKSMTSFRKFKHFSIQIGSFSKILSPGFRLGWIKSDRIILKQIEKLKQAWDLNSNQLSQVAVVNFFEIEKGFSYLKHIREQYEQKSRVFKDFANHYLPDFEFSKITGGMFYWVKTPFNDSYRFFETALNLGVAVVPGQEFDPIQAPSFFLRMNFTGAKESEMEEGFQKMKLAWKQLT